MILVFCILAPLVLLYALGYRLDIKTGQLVRTGVFVLASKPNRASILLNGALAAEKTNARIDAVVAGSYKVQVQKDGYREWEKTLRVNPGESTIADHIVLFKDVLTPQTAFTQNDLQDVRKVKDDTFLLVQQSGATATLSYWFRQQTAPVLLGTFPGTLRIIAVHAPAEKVLLQRTENGMSEYLIGDLSPYLGLNMQTAVRMPVQILGTLATVDAQKISWDVQNEHILWVLKDQQLIQFNIEEGTAQQLERGILDMFSTREGLLVLAKTAAGTRVHRLGLRQQYDIDFDAGNEYTRFLASQDQYIVLTGNHETALFYALRPGFADKTILSGPIQYAEWQAKKNLLLWSATELVVYETRTRSIIPLTRFSNPLAYATWYANEAYVAYMQDGIFVVMETDTRDRRNHTEIPLESGTTLLTMTQNGKTAWFFTAPGIGPGQLWFVQLR